MNNTPAIFFRSALTYLLSGSTLAFSPSACPPGDPSFPRVPDSLRLSRLLSGCALACLLSCILATPCLAQMDPPSSRETQFKDYRNNVLQEKIFVHTDKPFYLAGEILWCKLYCVEGSSHIPLDLSKVAYIELLNKEDRPVLQGKVLLEKGEGRGSFYLPPSLNSGYYRLRAYTNWMKNLGPDAFFEETLTIVNSFKGLPLPSAADSADPTNSTDPTAPDHASLITATPPANPAAVNSGITANPSTSASPALTASSPSATPVTSILSQPPGIRPFLYYMGFYPEGGNLVNGIRSKIAFEITDAEGKGVEAKGWVVNEKKDTLADFQPLQDGLGNFWLTPLAAHTYTAILLFPDGSIRTKALPAAYDRGYVLRVEEADPQYPVADPQHPAAAPHHPAADSRHLAISVYASPGTSSGDLHLFIRTGLPENIVEKVSLSGDSAVLLLDKDRLGEGVSQFTLFDAAGQPVCERLYGIPPHRRLTIEAETDQQEYGTRKKVHLSLSVKGEDGRQLPASLSMAVYRLDSLQTALPGDLLTYLWLGSEVKGRIASPEQYTEGQGPKAQQTLDNLLLTHGWRRFRWEDIGRRPAGAAMFPPEIRGQLISGRLTDLRTGLPVSGVTTYLSVPGIRYQFACARTDEEGKFLFDIKDFYGSGGILVETNTPKDSIYKIEIFSPYSEQYSKNALPPFSLADTQRRRLVERSIGMQVQNIYTGDSLKKFRPPSLDSLRFYGRPDYTYQLDDYTRFTTMEEVLREYVREINVNHYQGRLHVLMLNEPIRQFFDDNNTLVMLDGIPVLDDRIFAYDPLKVKTLEVIPRQYIMGPSSFSGIASFTTYKGDYEALELDPRSLLIDYDGLQLQREYYSPVYETPQQTASRLPDFRNLLCWAPDLHTGAQGQLGSGFYTSDLPGKYLVVIQGLSADGRAGVKYVNFEVRP